MRADLLSSVFRIFNATQHAPPASMVTLDQTYAPICCVGQMAKISTTGGTVLIHCQREFFFFSQVFPAHSQVFPAHLGPDVAIRGFGTALGNAAGL